MLTTQRRLFIPNAVYIPVKDGKEGKDFDRDDCTLLLVDGEFSHGDVYTEEAWKNGGEPAYIQRQGDFFLPDGSELPVGRVQLLPDTCIVKIPERQHWSEDVQALTTRMFGVYALNRRLHFHLCEFCASYELWFIETQYEETDEVAADEEKRDELNQIILRRRQPSQSSTCTSRTSSRCSGVAAVVVPAGCPRTIMAAAIVCGA